jgi:hypothetical protein
MLRPASQKAQPCLPVMNNCCSQMRCCARYQSSQSANRAEPCFQFCVCPVLRDGHPTIAVLLRPIRDRDRVCARQNRFVDAPNRFATDPESDVAYLHSFCASKSARL